MKSMSIGALIAIVVALVPDALAHFSQYVPPARNICNLDPRWGRSGGAGQGSGQGFNRPSPCGDPYFATMRTENYPGDSTYYNPEYECEPYVTYEGSMITTNFVFYAHHGGFVRCAINVNRYSEEWVEEEFIYMNTTDQDPHGSDRYYLLDNYVSIEGRHVEYNVTWQLPYGVTTEHGIMSCEFITAHKCAPARGCDPAICGMYSIGEDTWGWPDDPLKAEEPCEDPLNAVPTQGPQIFRQCADISLVGVGNATLPSPTLAASPAPAPPPPPPSQPFESLPAPEPVAEEMPPPPPDFVEENDPPLNLGIREPPMGARAPMGLGAAPIPGPPVEGPTMGEPSLDASSISGTPRGAAPMLTPPLGRGPMTAPPEGAAPMGAENPIQESMLVGLVVVDSGNDFETYFDYMSGVTITVSDYPYGFGIRALVEDSSQVLTVSFATSEGYCHMEYHETYDMFPGSENRTWHDPPIGSTVSLEVIAALKDGAQSYISTSITFE